MKYDFINLSYNPVEESSGSVLFVWFSRELTLEEKKWVENSLPRPLSILKPTEWTGEILDIKADHFFGIYVRSAYGPDKELGFDEAFAKIMEVPVIKEKKRIGSKPQVDFENIENYFGWDSSEEYRPTENEWGAYNKEVTQWAVEINKKIPILLLFKPEVDDGKERDDWYDWRIKKIHSLFPYFEKKIVGSQEKNGLKLGVIFFMFPDIAKLYLDYMQDKGNLPTPDERNNLDKLYNLLCKSNASGYGFIDSVNLSLILKCTKILCPKAKIEFYSKIDSSIRYYLISENLSFFIEELGVDYVFSEIEKMISDKNEKTITEENRNKYILSELKVLIVMQEDNVSLMKRIVERLLSKKFYETILEETEKAVFSLSTPEASRRSALEMKSILRKENSISNMLIEIAFRLNKKNNFKNAEEYYLMAISFPSCPLMAYVNLLGLYFNNKMWKKAEDLADRVQLFAKNNPYIFHHTACIYTAVGRINDALKQVELAKEYNYELLERMKTDIDLEPLFSDPKFQKIFE